MSTTTHLDAWTQRQEDRGYEHVSDRRCPRRLVGKRHLYEKCWCCSRLNDHAATYNRHGEKLVLWEPYQAHPEELAVVFARAAADGIQVYVHGMSPYYPGGTLAIEFHAHEVTP